MATWNSNLIIAGGGQANPSVMPGTARPVQGSIVIPASAQIALNDTFPLFYIGAGSAAHIFSYWFDSPALDSGATLTMSFLDSTTPTPTTFFSAVTGFRAGAVITSVTAARASMGSAVNYVAPNLLFLRAAAGAGANVGGTAVVVYFGFEINRD